MSRDLLDDDRDVIDHTPPVGTGNPVDDAGPVKFAEEYRVDVRRVQESMARPIVREAA